MPIKISLFNKPQCFTKSALERNLKASASSKKPNTTFTEFNQPPDFGNELSQLGNSANKAKGIANAKPNPPIPNVSCIAPPSEAKDPASKDPKIGPVHEKDTNAKVSAMKKIPMIFPEPAFVSAPVDNDAGNVIS